MFIVKRDTSVQICEKVKNWERHVEINYFLADKQQHFG